MDYEICDLQQNASTATQSSDENERTRWGFIYFHPKSGEGSTTPFVARRKSHNEIMSENMSEILSEILSEMNFSL